MFPRFDRISFAWKEPSFAFKITSHSFYILFRFLSFASVSFETDTLSNFINSTDQWEWRYNNRNGKLGRNSMECGGIEDCIMRAIPVIDPEGGKVATLWWDWRGKPFVDSKVCVVLKAWNFFEESVGENVYKLSWVLGQREGITFLTQKRIEEVLRKNSNSPSLSSTRSVFISFSLHPSQSSTLYPLLSPPHTTMIRNWSQTFDLSS